MLALIACGKALRLLRYRDSETQLKLQERRLSSRVRRDFRESPDCSEFAHDRKQPQYFSNISFEAKTHIR